MAGFTRKSFTQLKKGIGAQGITNQTPKPLLSLGKPRGPGPEARRAKAQGDSWFNFEVE